MPPKKKTKVEYVPYPVKQYVPVIKEKPIIVEVEKEMKMPMMQMKSHMAGIDMDEMGWGMDSKKSVTHLTPNKQSNDKQKKKL